MFLTALLSDGPDGGRVAGSAPKYFSKLQCDHLTEWKENAMQPLNTPDLQEIVEEAGEDGLQMCPGSEQERKGLVCSVYS